MDHTCDLVVHHFESPLSFFLHIKKVCNQSFKLFGIVFRNTKHFRYSHSFKIIFNSLVRSKVEYCSIIGSPHVQHQSDNIERVQNKFLKMLHINPHHLRFSTSNYTSSRHLRMELNVQRLSSHR